MKFRDEITNENNFLTMQISRAFDESPGWGDHFILQLRRTSDLIHGYSKIKVTCDGVMIENELMSLTKKQGVKTYKFPISRSGEYEFTCDVYAFNLEKEKGTSRFSKENRLDHFNGSSLTFVGTIQGAAGTVISREKLSQTNKKVKTSAARAPGRLSLADFDIPTLRSQDNEYYEEFEENNYEDFDFN